MSGLLDFSNAAATTSAAYANYILRAATHSVRSLQLGEQVIACVARRQLTPERLASSLTRYAEADAGQSATKATVAIARFVAGLASSVVLPVEQDATLGDIVRADLLGSLQKRAEQSAARNVAAVNAYLAQLADVAAGKMTPDDYRRANARLYSRATADELGRLAQLWFELLADLDESRAAFSEHYMLGVLRELNPIGFDGEVVELAGPIDSTISTVLTLENVHREPVVVRCGVSDVRRADGVGPAFAPRLVLEPELLALDNAAEASLRLSLWLDKAIYETGSPYIGMLHLTRDGEWRHDVPLRISPTLSTA